MMVEKHITELLTIEPKHEKALSLIQSIESLPGSSTQEKIHNCELLKIEREKIEKKIQSVKIGQQVHEMTQRLKTIRSLKPKSQIAQIR